MILERIKQSNLVPDAIKDQAATLRTQKRAAERWVREHVYEARTKGEDGLWDLHLQAISGAGKMLDRAADLPAIHHGVHTARGLLDQIERATTRPPIADYDEHNVREVMDALHGLDRLGLLRVERYERHHKNRKTILDAVTREHDRRARLAGYPR